MDTEFEPPLRVEALPMQHGAVRPALEKCCSLEQLYHALNGRHDMPVGKLGDLMIEARLITPEQLDVALQFQRHNEKKHLGEILVDLGLLSRDQLYLALCEKLGIPFVDLAKFVIDPRLLKVLPDEIVRKNGIVPLCYTDGRLVIAVADPLDTRPLEHVRFFTQAAVTRVMATAEDIERTIVLYYGGSPERHEVQQNAQQLREELRVDADSNGYRGRIGLFELLTVTPHLRQMMLRRASAAELRAVAIADGMRTLKQDGIEKVLSGETVLHEVRAAAL